MNRFKALAIKVSTASKPDRELDALIWAELDGRDVREDKNMVLGRSRKAPHDECILGFIDPGERSRNFYTAGLHKPPLPNYTHSLDAAASLIPEGFDWILERVNDGMTIGARVGHNDPDKTTWGDTPALALCAAALYARAELI